MSDERSTAAALLAQLALKGEPIDMRTGYMVRARINNAWVTLDLTELTASTVLLWLAAFPNDGVIRVMDTIRKLAEEALAADAADIEETGPTPEEMVEAVKRVGDKIDEDLQQPSFAPLPKKNGEG